MRILGLRESLLLELTPHVSQACVGGLLTLSAASGTSEHNLALWQQRFPTSARAPEAATL